MSPWNLIGTPGYAGVAAGTVTLPSDACLLQIIVHATAAAATVSIFGGAAIPIVAGAAPTVINFNHRLFSAQGVGGNAQVVGVNTDSLFVHWCRSGNV